MYINESTFQSHFQPHFIMYFHCNARYAPSWCITLWHMLGVQRSSANVGISRFSLVPRFLLFCYEEKPTRTQTRFEYGTRCQFFLILSSLTLFIFSPLLSPFPLFPLLPPYLSVPVPFLSLYHPFQLFVLIYYQRLRRCHTSGIVWPHGGENENFEGVGGCT